VSAAPTRHVLVVSDDSATDVSLRDAFTHSAPDCNVHIARTRKEIEGLNPPNLILLDLMLSSEPPFDVLRWLKAEPRYTEVPVFVLGSSVIEHEINEAYALGANSCLLKENEPIGLEKIALAMATYITLIKSSCSTYTA
jgi:CheY-like chemotaxis protein